MDYTLELVVVPVSDVDRAKAFYIEQLGFDLLVDSQMGPGFRVVQLTPRGSACSIALMKAGAVPTISVKLCGALVPTAFVALMLSG